MALLFTLAGAAGAEWRVDSTPIAWTDAHEPANAISARLQVGCLQDGRMGSVVLSAELPPGRIGLSFRFDQGAIEHQIAPVESDLRSVMLLGIRADRLSKGKRFRIALHPIGKESLFYDFSLSGSAAAIAAVQCGNQQIRTRTKTR